MFVPASLRDLPRRGLVRAVPFVMVAYLVCALAPLTGPARVRLGYVGEALLLAFELLALAQVLSRVRHPEERRFWGCIAAGLACWLASQVLLAWQPISPGELNLLTDGLYLLNYVSLFLAADQQPHLEAGWSHEDKPYRCSVLGTLACGLAFVVYFVLVPGLAYAAPSVAQVSSYALLVSLDAVVAWRFLRLRLRADGGPWRSTYGLLALTYGVWAALDLQEGLSQRGILQLPAAAYAFWQTPHLILLVALFMHEVALVGGAASGPAEVARREPTSLLAAAFSLPLLHLMLDSSGLVVPGSRRWLALTALASAVVVGGLALALQLFFERSNSSLRAELTLQSSQALRDEGLRLEAIGRLSSNAAQALERLLTLVLGHAGFIRAGLAPIDRLGRHCAELERATHRAAAIARLLLDSGPPAAGERRPVELGAVVEDMSAALGVLLGERMRLRTTVEPEAGTVQAERAQLEQLIAGLAVAAAEAQGGEGELTLEVGRRDQAHSMPWIRPEEHEPQVLLLASWNKGPRPAGACGGSDGRVLTSAGLFAAREPARLAELVAAQGGRLWIPAGTGGAGPSSMYVAFPSQEARVAQAHVGPKNEAPVAGSESLLLIEAEDGIRLLMSETLRQAGYGVVEAASLGVGLDLARNHPLPFDLVVFDAGLPDVRGDLRERLARWQPAARLLEVGPARRRSDVAGRPQPHLQRPSSGSALLQAVRRVLDEAPSLGQPGSGRSRQTTDAVLVAPLRFLSGTWEDDYRQQTFQETLLVGRVWAASGLALYPLLVLADLWLPADSLPLALGLRVGLVLPLIVGVVAFVLRAEAGRHWPTFERLTLVAVAGAGLGVAAAHYLAPPEMKSLYTAQLLLLMAYAAGMVWLRLPQIIGLALLFSAAVQISLLLRPVPSTLLFATEALLVGGAAASIAIKYNYELTRRRAFRTNRRLATEKARTEYLVNIDEVTQLPNRLLALDRLAQALHAARRRQQVVALLFIDLDHFKRINDTLGHLAGDELLRQAADRLRRLVRLEDTVARFGGDEFTVILPALAEPAHAEHVARKILEDLRRPFLIARREVTVPATIGIAVYPHDGETSETLLQNADAAMYAAKSQGRDTYCFFTQQLNDQARRLVQLENQLRKSLERDEIRLHYQPIVDARTGAIRSVEALLRWHNAELGDVAPSEFIPVAEETGLIESIGGWALARACQQVGEWRRRLGLELTVAVNVSARQFAGAQLDRLVEEALRESGLPGVALELEITESTLMRDLGQVSALTAKLWRRGVRLSIDDFGTGYSALSYLTSLPVASLKIDRVFVKDLSAQRDSLVEAIVTMAHKLGLRVVAEGVETEEQHRLLLACHCDLLQGFLFAPALPPAELEELLVRSAGLGRRTTTAE